MKTTIHLFAAIEYVCNDLAEAMKACGSHEGFRRKKADWYPLLLGKLAESVVVISGAPNVGNSLAVHLARTLGLTRTKTTSKNFWLFARSQRPYFSLWVYCTDSFWSEDEPSWPRMRQSVSSITSSEEFGTGAVILEGHRIFAFPGYADLATTIVYLAATDKLFV